MDFYHKPALLQEAIGLINLKSKQKVIDCTVGGGGHAIPILKAIGPSGRMLGIDLDPTALRAFEEKIKKEKKDKNIILVNNNFKNLKQITKDYNFSDVDAILIDLGVSTNQLKDAARGFGFTSAKLDMRIDSGSVLTAEQIVNGKSEAELIKIFSEYGEERLAKPIVKEIVIARQTQRLTKPEHLVNIVSSVYQRFYKKRSKLNPATKIFLALRIAVNDELENIRAVLPQAVEILKANGRLAIISFNSLEDRIVKNFFKQESRDCICPPQVPACVCDHRAKLKIITKKPVKPTPEEITDNPAARSALLRVAEKI